MTAVTASIDIAVPPAEVSKVVMDPHRFGDWVTIHRKLGKVDRGDVREGFAVEQTLCIHRANFKVHWQLAEWDEPFHAVWEGRGPAGSKARTAYTLSAIDGGAATRFEYSNEYANPGGILGRLAGRVLVQGVAEREANRSLERLKELLEGGRAADGR